jgi:ribonucleoside-diphosphate reductase beta chain
MNKNIFLPRTNILPYEYPQLLAYKDAIRHSYWIDTEFNFTEDIQDFKVTINSKERDVIKKTMLAIAQIEVNVKTFWADMYKRMPITEVGDVGMTFAESEVRHKDAYARLLRILGLENEFKKVIEVPAIENIIMMSFNKEKNLFKGISNVVEATSKEEEIHGNFGIEIINIIKKENPDWFDEEFRSLIYSACRKAYVAECGILDWIFEKGELDFLPIETIKHFIKNRFNNSLKSIGMTEIFEIDLDILESTRWFDVEITATKEGDFFYKKQIDYNKKSKSITEDDLF